MKKLLFVAVAALGFAFNANAQDGTATSKGSILVEANTNFGAGHAANTGFTFASRDGFTQWNIGAEGGYFIQDDLAIKVGLGYGDTDIDGIETNGIFSYKAGAKYYINSMIPVQLDLNGYSTDGLNPMFVGLQGGYAWFLADNIAIEPGVRYDLDLNDDAEGRDAFSLNIGFSLFF
ncbi:hypothetical protein SAMN04487906_2920 [Zhouia amylolytica]|uniref:Outer membrane protein beta-barrel domain-containing protein n=1 Tax=Zhouia amylolytica TaxID=376730 RepID=A0A1I6V7K2_9FLAO|nr:hypothetical protein [Zhouia amylolytica]SFT09600.1 hypothetical protein SAMN04487906_2920 [Zhouia amylolytica]